MAQTAGIKAALVPEPFPVWDMLARAGELLLNLSIARNQIELMHSDNVISLCTPAD
jgi:hypothetical protein